MGDTIPCQLRKARQILNLPIRQVCKDLVITRATFDNAESPRHFNSVRPALIEKLRTYYETRGARFADGDVTFTGVNLAFVATSKLNELRIDVGRTAMSVGALADSAGLSRKYVQQILAGQKPLMELAYRSLRNALDRSF